MQTAALHRDLRRTRLCRIRATHHSRGDHREVPPDPAQNKVLVIMSHGNLPAQAYRSTGCVSDSRGCPLAGPGILALDSGTAPQGVNWTLPRPSITLSFYTL